MAKINKPKILRKKLLAVVISALIMTLYEMIKQFMFPKITFWESHLLTIIAVSLISFCFAIFYFKNIKMIKLYKEELNKKFNYHMN